MLLVSIRPRFVEAILAGRKQVELRRRRPRISTGPGLIYSTSPSKAIVASFTIETIICSPLETLWHNHCHVSGVNRQEFFSYFAGLDVGYAIVLRNVIRLDRPIQLDILRDRLVGFRPPQSFCYLRPAQLEKIDPNCSITPD